MVSKTAQLPEAKGEEIKIKPLTFEMQTWQFPKLKETFVEGEWMDEPDFALWLDPVTGLSCMMRRSPAWLCWNGYVGVKSESTLFKVDCNEVDTYVKVHGGLTFSDHHEDLGFDDVWWFGFDTEHYGDFNCITKESQTTYLRDLSVGQNKDRYRSFEYVKEQVRLLCLSLNELQLGQDRRRHDRNKYKTLRYKDKEFLVYRANPQQAHHTSMNIFYVDGNLWGDVYSDTHSDGFVGRAGMRIVTVSQSVRLAVNDVCESLLKLGDEPANLDLVAQMDDYYESIGKTKVRD